MLRRVNGRVVGELVSKENDDGCSFGGFKGFCS